MPDLPKPPKPPKPPEVPEPAASADRIRGDGPDLPDLPDPDLAAAAALLRARQAAAAKGLRPGSRRAGRRPRATPVSLSGSARDGRDPLPLGEQLDRLLVDRGWQIDVAAGAIMARWPAIVGPEVARHCQPIRFERGVLEIRAESSAWAAQLSTLNATLMHLIEAEVGTDTVHDLRILGPSAPTWRRGRLRVTGRGPRDTYG